MRKQWSVLVFVLAAAVTTRAHFLFVVPGPWWC
jgi:hypothetical protein